MNYDNNNYREALSIPVFANGNILYFEDIQKCLDATGADGVMAAEGNLHNPALFANVNPPVWELAEEYLEICRTVPTKLSYIRGHLFKLFRSVLSLHVDIREGLGKATSEEAMRTLTAELKLRLQVIW